MLGTTPARTRDKFNFRIFLGRAASSLMTRATPTALSVGGFALRRSLFPAIMSKMKSLPPFGQWREASQGAT